MANFSRRLSARRPIMVGAAATCIAILALLNWHLLVNPVDISPIPEGAPPIASRDRPASNLTTRLDGKAAGVFEETIARPLFNSNRRPVERSIPKAPNAPIEESPLEMRLVGVVRLGSVPGRALIRLANEATGRWISEGEVVNGWRLRAIKDKSVVVESQGRSHELSILRSPDKQDGGPERSSKSR